ncbi:MAG TPA: flagellar filament capping protein FliD [Terracidiphilus sp.]|nr:flagellar filament capping protein FliD [Terracidiphilus sp.]
MGTVGLSFGSPTSGAGFDVSATVSQIVANLQGVETPWQTQLTSLESQDTVISNLGTLFSNLSNDMSQLTDFNGILSEKTGSSSNTNVLELTAASSSASAGTHTVTVNSLAQTSSGYLAEIANASDALTGSITLQVGEGDTETFTIGAAPSSGAAANTIYTGAATGDDTLAALSAAINASGVGITSSVLTDATGSRLSLVSATSGAAGDITATGNSLTDAVPNTLSYSGAAGTGTTTSSGTLSPVASLSDTLQGSISIQVGNGTAVSVAVPTNATLAGLASAINGTNGIGVTASIVTNSDGTSSLALVSGTSGPAGTLTVNSSVTDSATALNFNNAVTGANASLTVDGVNLTSASNTVTDLIPGVTFQLLSSSSSPVQVVIGNDNSDVESTVGQFVSDYNALISALNTQEGNTSSGTPEPLFGSPTLSLLQEELLSGLSVENPNGYLDPVASVPGATISGSLSIQVGGQTAENVVIGAAPATPAANTIYTGSGVNTLSGLASAINAADIGVNAGVVTSQNESTLTLTSQTAGADGGALTVSSALNSQTPSALGFTDSGYTSSTPDSGTIGTLAASADALSGSLTIQVGNGVVNNIALDPSDGTLAGLANAINSAQIGVTAAVNTNGTGVTLTSGTNGAAGALTVNTSLYDTTDTTSAALGYNSSSDINSLTALGISVNNDGSLTFDAASLDSVLNSDYSGVVGFFQNANSWGQSFSNMLDNAGTSSSTGILALASSANSSTESSLNAEISKEQSYISAQQSSLTAELTQANEILQELPNQLDGVNELYSAITGYNENSAG